MFLEGMGSLLKASGWVDVGATTATTRTLPGLIRTHSPNLLLLDRWLDKDDALEWINEHADLVAGMWVIVLTADSDTQLPEAQVACSAWSLVPKSSGIAHLLAELERLSGTALPMPVGSRRDVALEETGITPREREIMVLIAEGLTPKRIAERLGISSNTVYVHIASLKRKSGTASMAQLALWGAALPD